MNEQHNYTIHLDVKFGFLELINVPSLVTTCKEQWFN